MQALLQIRNPFRFLPLDHPAGTESEGTCDGGCHGDDHFEHQAPDCFFLAGIFHKQLRLRFI